MDRTQLRSLRAYSSPTTQALARREALGITDLVVWEAAYLLKIGRDLAALSALGINSTKSSLAYRTAVMESLELTSFDGMPMLAKKPIALDVDEERGEALERVR